jgi:hypothetical protein
MNDMDEWIRTDIEGRLQRHGIRNGDDLNQAQRMTFASTAEEVLQNACDIRMPVLLPLDFAIHVNEVVKKALIKARLPEETVLEPIMIESGSPEAQTDSSGEGLFSWVIGSQLMWQQVDRQIDE